MKGFQRFMRWLHAGKRAALASGMALLAGCALLQGVPPAPSTLPSLDGARQFRAMTCGENADGRQSLVVVQPLGPTAWRWLQLDAFGAPRARQIIENGQWRNDGFLPPNQSAVCGTDDPPGAQRRHGPRVPPAAGAAPGRDRALHAGQHIALANSHTWRCGAGVGAYATGG